MVCPICRGKICSLVETWGNYSMHHCKTCDVVFADPMKSGVDYYENHVGYLLRDRLLIDQLQWDYRWDIMQFLKGPPDRKGNLLDIGCGTGFFVKRAVKMGFNGYGIELNERSIRIGREYFNLETLYPLSLKEFITVNPGLKFDVVTLFQVLEHIEDPHCLMEEIESVTHKDTIVIISVPNRERWPDPSGKESDSPPHHLTRWSLKALDYFLHRHGFSIKTYRIENFPLPNISSLAYRYFLKFMPSVTMKGQHIERKIDDITMDQAEHILKLRKAKMTMVNIMGIPVWLILKLLGAKGPSLYLEAKLQ
jgi:SAM-dependent methyltransferase